MSALAQFTVALNHPHPSSVRTPGFIGSAFVSCVLLLGCSGENQREAGRDGDSRSKHHVGQMQGGPSDFGEPQVGTNDVAVDGVGGAAPASAPGVGNPEVCDGVDNDGDGMIDNVDVGGDGICDCLNIGTIGRIGPYSDGGDVFKEWLNSRSPRPATELGDQVLTDELLAPLDVIVVLRVDTASLSRDDSPPHHEFSANEVDALRRWVEAGGGMMTTIGYQGNEGAEIVNVNRLLEPFSLGYDPSGLDFGGPLSSWDGDHPIAMGISNIHVNNGVAPLDSGVVVARNGDDAVGVVAQRAGEGGVIVFGDEWITYDSEWQDTEDQQVELLWLNMLKWMSPAEECQVEIPPVFVR